MKTKNKSIALFVGIIMILHSFLPILALANDDIPDDLEPAIISETEASLENQTTYLSNEIPDEPSESYESQTPESYKQTEYNSNSELAELEELEDNFIIDDVDEKLVDDIGEAPSTIEDELRTEPMDNQDSLENFKDFDEIIDLEAELNNPELDKLNSQETDNDINTIPPKGKITVKKNLLNNLNILKKPLSFSFQLTGPNGYVENFSLSPGDSKEFTNLQYGEYTLVGTETHGFIPYYTPADGKVKLSDFANTATINVTNTMSTDHFTSITLTKQWRGNDPNERPEVRIDLIANFFDNNGIELNQYVDSFYANGSKTSATFENLPIYSPWGTLIEYYALESSVPINYVAEHNGTTVINTYTGVPQTKSITANKIWVDDLDNYPSQRPAIWFKLSGYDSMGNLISHPDIKKLEPGMTSVTWDDVPILDEYGQPYTGLFVTEVDEQGNPWVPEGYEKTEDGLAVTNKKKDNFTSVTANKIWVDDLDNYPSQRPAIWFKLSGYDSMGNLISHPDIKKLEPGMTSVTWDDVPILDEYGQPYTGLFVTEVDGSGNPWVPEGYEKTEDGLAVTNKKKDNCTSVTANKIWVDDLDNYPSQRPAIWFKLSGYDSMGNLISHPDIKKLEPGMTSVTWDDVPILDEYGQPYTGLFVTEVDENGNPWIPEGTKN